MSRSALRVAILSFTCGCGAHGTPADGDRQRLIGPSAESSREASSEPNTCSLSSSSKLFVAATQVSFDYQPLRGDALVQGSKVIARGRATELAVGRTLLGHQHTSVLTIQVDKSYKSERALGAFIYVELVRNPSVTPDDLAALASRLPEQPLTVFLTDAHDLSRHPAAQVPDGEALYALLTPQALVFSSPCAVAQPLAPDAPIFGEEVASEQALDEAIADAVENR